MIFPELLKKIIDHDIYIRFVNIGEGVSLKKMNEVVVGESDTLADIEKNVDDLIKKKGDVLQFRKKYNAFTKQAV